MDRLIQKEHLREAIRKYRYLLLAVLLGILFMGIPQKEQNPPAPEEPVTIRPPDLEAELAAVLSHVSGAGRVEVLLTQAEGEKTLYQTDDTGNGTDTRSDTVLVSSADREETGLVRQILPPVYRGAVVLCQGADNAQVKLDMVEAVKTVTGLPSDRITVLKMK